MLSFIPFPQWNEATDRPRDAAEASETKRRGSKGPRLCRAATKKVSVDRLLKFEGTSIVIRPLCFPKFVYLLLCKLTV